MSQNALAPVTLLALLVMGLLVMRSRRNWTVQRSFTETCVAAGDELITAVPMSLLVGVLGLLIAGVNWDRGTAAVVVVALLTYPAVFAGSFVVRLLRNSRHPDRHEFWRRMPTQVIPHSGSPFLQVQIMGTTLLTGGYPCRCSLTTPQGQTFRAEPGMLMVRYPNVGGIPFFPDDPPALTVGRHEIYWTDPTDGKERPLLRYSVEVTQPALEEETVTDLG